MKFTKIKNIDDVQLDYYYNIKNLESRYKNLDNSINKCIDFLEVIEVTEQLEELDTQINLLIEKLNNYYINNYNKSYCDCRYNEIYNILNN